MANLLTGDFTLADGTQGNIYGSPSSPSKPNTSTLTLPTQFTGSGIGSVIPLTALGQEITYTTTIPGTTVPPSTIAVLTIDPSTVSGSTVVPATTKFSTIAGTTIPPQTSTVTTVVAHSSSTPSSAVAIVRPRSNFVETVSVCVALFIGLNLLQLRSLLVSFL